MKHSKTILIAEDEKQTRETVTLVLKNAGYQILHALNGRETLDILLERQDSDSPVDLVILERDISALRGPRVAEELKRLGIQVPLLVVAGLLDERNSQDAEGDACLRRPFEPDDVLASVSELLCGHNRDRETAGSAAQEEKSPSTPDLPDWNELPVTFSTRRTLMNLAELLHEQCIQANAVATDKRSVLRAIAQLAHTHPLLAERNIEEIERGLQKREDTGSTGFGDGIAIPHCALENLSDFVVGILTIPDGVDFDAIDGQSARLFVFIIAPASRRNEHIRVLSAISSVLRAPANVREILEGSTPAAIRTSFLRHTRIEVDESQKGYNLFTVIVQREEMFEELLSQFTEIQDCFVSVLEANNAGRYLYALPLFSSFWTSEKKGFQRVILATVKKTRANETLRKMNMLLEESGITSGVLVLLQDVLYMNGTLDL